MRTQTPKIPTILFMEGVFKHDCKLIDDIFEKRLIGQIHQIKLSKYKAVNRVFTGMDTWMASTNTKCFYCDLFFTFIPCFIPKKIEVLKTITVIPEGCFCSFNCCAKQVSEKYSVKMQNEKEKMLKYMYHIYYPDADPNVTIHPSPNKYEMIHYDEGSLTKEEYRKKIIELQKIGNMKITM
jgi:hypothetical protein